MTNTAHVMHIVASDPATKERLNELSKLTPKELSIAQAETDEFNRIEREAKQRMAAVRYVLDKLAEENKRLGLSLLTDEELDALNEEPK